jgi:hypothetical protein
MRGRAVRTLLSAATVLLVSGLCHAQCSKDTDCKGDRVCTAGKCTAPHALPPAPPGNEATPGAPQAPPATPATGEPANGATPSGEPTSASPAPGPAAAPVATVAPPPAPPVVSAPTPAQATTSAGQDQPPVHRRNRTAMITGIVLASLGPVALLAALSAKNDQDTCDTQLQRDYPDRRLPPSERYRVDACNAYSVPLYLFGIGGAVLAAVGIPLIIYGSKPVPAGAPRASLRVLPWAAPGSSGVRLQLSM